MRLSESDDCFGHAPRGKTEPVRSFLADFLEGKPVIVYGSKGEMLGIPCGFAMFPDGISWADDGVTQDYCSHQPYHHLYGGIKSVGEELRCAGLRFAPAPIWDAEFGNAWAAIDRSVIRWQSVRRFASARVKEDRIQRKLQAAKG